jgi:predicted RNase H-like HicB family nuclease
MELSELLAVPFTMIVYSVEHEDGSWRRRAEYPELPGVFAEARTAVEAMEEVERAKVRYLSATHARGEDVPASRPPLRTGGSGLGGAAIRQILEEPAGRTTESGSWTSG